MKKSICIEKLFIELPFYDRFAAVREAGFDYIEFGSALSSSISRGLTAFNKYSAEKFK